MSFIITCKKICNKLGLTPFENMLDDYIDIQHNHKVQRNKFRLLLGAISFLGGIIVPSYYNENITNFFEKLTTTLLPALEPLPLTAVLYVGSSVIFTWGGLLIAKYGAKAWYSCKTGDSNSTHHLNEDEYRVLVEKYKMHLEYKAHLHNKNAILKDDTDISRELTDKFRELVAQIGECEELGDKFNTHGVTKPALKKMLYDFRQGNFDAYESSLYGLQESKTREKTKMDELTTFLATQKLSTGKTESSNLSSSSNAYRAINVDPENNSPSPDDSVTPHIQHPAHSRTRSRRQSTSTIAIEKYTKSKVIAKNQLDAMNRDSNILLSKIR